jgi:O-antigen/teichoic acid export membrane protein
MNNKEHTQVTLSGLKWSGLSQFALQLISFIFNIILARLLSPKEFGIIAIITVFVGFLSLFKDFGFGAVLISKEKVDDLDYSTVFWTNLGLGALMTIVLCFSGTYIADFYTEPRLEQLIYVVSFLFVVQAFNFVQIIILKRQLKFKKLAAVSVFSILFSGIIGIIFALMGFGVWSLIIKDLAHACIYLIIIWRISSWKPAFKFSTQRFRYFLSTGFALIGTKSLNYVSRSLDNLLIGKYIGFLGLGIYNRAYSFMTFPVYKITGVLSSVLFPSLSIIQNDLQRIKDIFLKSTQITAFVIFMIMGLVYVNATEFVLLVLGEQWKDLIPILKIFSLPSALQSITILTENIFRSQNKYKLEFKLNIAVSIILIVAIIIGLQYGIIGVAYAYSAAVIFTSILTFHVTSKFLNINIFTILNKIYPSFIGFISLILAKYIYDLLNKETELNLWLNFIIQIVFGATIYLLIIFVINKSTFYSVLSLIKKFRT